MCMFHFVLRGVSHYLGKIYYRKYIYMLFRMNVSLLVIVSELLPMFFQLTWRFATFTSLLLSIVLIFYVTNTISIYTQLRVTTYSTVLHLLFTLLPSASLIG